MESKSSEPAAAAAEPSRRSPVPIVAGVLALIALFLVIALWPDSDTKSTPQRAGKSHGGSVAEGGGDDKAKGRTGAGVAARAYDEPSAPTRTGKMNPAVRLPQLGMAPEGAIPQDDKPPEFTSKADEIAWYERKLEQANKNLEARKKFYDHLPEVRARIEKGPDAQRQLQMFEGRKKIVEDNYAKAQASVVEVERKLKELRGG